MSVRMFPQQLQTHPTYCRICEAACGLLADVDTSGQAVGIRPDRQHPVSRGFVCAKGTRFLEVANHPGRLQHPLRRRPNGGYERLTWPKAIELFGQHLRPILEQYGPHAVGIYFGNPLAFNALGALSMVAFMRAIGTRNVFNAGSQDCNNKFAGAQILHGSPLIHPIPDFEHADLAILFGTNPAVSQSSFVHLSGGTFVFDDLVEHGGRLIWVDPRRTESARRWGEHVPIQPGTDVFLLLTLLHELRDLYRPDSRVTGLDQLLALAADCPLPRAATLTGLVPERIYELAQAIRTARQTTFHMSVGVNQGPFGTLCYVVLQALAYLSGNFDCRGGLLFHPLAVWAAGVARRLKIGTRAAQSRVGNFPSLLDSLPGGILADEILTPGLEQIRALIVLAGDPLKSIPGAAKLEQALSQLDFLVSLDLFTNATSRQADLLLPTTSWLERWDVATTTAFFQQVPLLQYSRPLQPGPGETRSEAHILADLSIAARRPLFGSRALTWLWKKLAWDTGLGVLTELVTWPTRRLLGGAQGLPVPKPRPGRYLGRGPRTPGRQVRFWQPELEGEQTRLVHFRAKIETQGAGAAVAEAGQGQPFTLICRRRRLGHNSWLHGALREGKAEETAWMALGDMARLGLSDGQSISIQTDAANLELPVKGIADLTPGLIVVPHGLPQANVNGLIPNTMEMIEPLSGQHRLTGIPVRVAPG